MATINLQNLLTTQIPKPSIQLNLPRCMVKRTTNASESLDLIQRKSTLEKAKRAKSARKALNRTTQQILVQIANESQDRFFKKLNQLAQQQQELMNEIDD
ncbi:Hypothetical_protein [Hexamita inflata]|uniref:Hypothetical_protein n=1 Tax=Hexamita inflata TaxID=28002 RepID=A0AA86RA97_9EUKA|nr:Hypothetical protein HINF_LOCUS56902 [Hexamita inflata]